LTYGITPNLGYLSNLEYLDISHNFLSQTIPATLSYLTKLTYLALDHQTLYIYSGYSYFLGGVIPAGLGSLKLLMHLDLGNNYLTGRVPAGFGRLLFYKASIYHI
jgi:Leucine-rich repeat (LRR) protein